ncbi:hypothetical protein C0995_014692 [Termitomyces sp. Mi166|nr:hypothetical protein C0995_014692 [Termitomyces sp. Mi166\
MLSGIPLPRLQSMKLVRSDKAATLRCGPFMLDSEMFRHLVLDGVVLRPADSSQFSGLRSLSIANTDLLMLDEIRIRLWTSASITTEPAPSMSSIQHLNISMPSLTDIPCSLSLDPSTLVSLKLNGIPFVSLIRKLLTENLRIFEVTDIDSTTAKTFLTSLPKEFKDLFPKLTDFSPSTFL